MSSSWEYGIHPAGNTLDSLRTLGMSLLLLCVHTSPVCVSLLPLLD